MTELAELKKRLMENPEFQKDHAVVDAEFSVIETLISARTGARRRRFTVACDIA